jgi:hypothetical protein
MAFEFTLEFDRDKLGILNRDLDMFAAYIRPIQYSVKTPEGDEVAIVKSVDEAIPALVAYYRAHDVDC